MSILKQLAGLIYIMFYYLLESTLFGGILYIAWISVIQKFMLVEPFSSIQITYINCIVIIWAYKLVTYNFMKVLNKYLGEESSD